MQPSRRIQVFLAVFVAFLPSCGGGNPDPYVGNMNDFTYAGRLGKVYGPTAEGRDLRMADLKGRFVWIDFSAPWCPPCRRQAPIMRELEKRYTGKVVFITMMTSDHSPGSPATRQTARQWARQYGLDPAHVVPTGESSRTIPQHIIFSPLGQTLDWQIGLKNDLQIRAMLAKRMREWNQWYSANKTSPSVLISEIGDLED